MRKNRRLGRLPLVLTVLAALAAVATGCQRNADRSTGVFVLMDATAADANPPNGSGSVVDRLLGSLAPGDTLALARIDSGGFDTTRRIAPTTFDPRPSVISAQKRLFRAHMARLPAPVGDHQAPDIFGGMLHAVHSLNQMPAQRKIILLMSDLNGGLPGKHIDEVPLHLQGIHVVALAPPPRDAPERAPDNHRQCLYRWQTRTESGGGIWRVLYDFESLDRLFKR